VTTFSIYSNASVALLSESGGRIFGLDAQLLFDILIQGFAVFLLFIFVGYLLVDPVRKMLEERQNKIESDIANAEKDKEDAAKLKAEYDAKLKAADSEVSDMLSAARKKALKNEENIVAEAKEEAARIIRGANQEAELEKNKVKDEVKQEIISVATVMAGKIVATSLDDKKQAELVDATLKEMGDDTWLSK
jgi:F-type H+-transporting ATPase subunit b